MDRFMSKKRKPVESDNPYESSERHQSTAKDEENDTETQLAILASLFPDYEYALLLDALTGTDGSVENATLLLAGGTDRSHFESGHFSKKLRTIGHQTSLSKYGLSRPNDDLVGRTRLTKRGRTLHLFSPEDVAAHTPCSIIHNFLPTQDADALLKELLDESKTFGRASFRIFDNVVQSPHSACFYVESLEERDRQKTEYLYNGGYLSDIRQLTTEMRAVSTKVKEAVNREISSRIKSHYPNAQKLRYQFPGTWLPNAAFVNCYTGGTESVGYHSDQLTYLGPRAIIGSISLGVAREFRVRRIVPPREDSNAEDGRTQADEQGQISIHLPHNSLLVMHAEMQEEWKHSISPAASIDPHPVSGNRRINITYRHYREEYHPRNTPRCRCNIATVLKCVQKKKENRGRYMWMCHAGQSPERNEGCGFFQWAEFDEDGQPPWWRDAKLKT